MDPAEQIERALADNRLAVADRLDEALGALAAWIEEHPDAEPADAMRTPEYAAVLAAVDSEIQANNGVLIESLPAMVQHA